MQTGLRFRCIDRQAYFWNMYPKQTASLSGMPRLTVDLIGVDTTDDIPWKIDGEINSVEQ
jgi:hypothetical protein